MSEKDCRCDCSKNPFILRKASMIRSIVTFAAPCTTRPLSFTFNSLSSFLTPRPVTHILSSKRITYSSRPLAPIVTTNMSMESSPTNPGIEAIVSSSRFKDYFAESIDSAAIPVDLVRVSDWSEYLDAQDDQTRKWISAFPNPAHFAVPIPSDTRSLSHYLVPVKDKSNPLWQTATALSQLPSNNSYFIRSDANISPFLMELAWGLHTYSFTLYKKPQEGDTIPTLVRVTKPGTFDRDQVNRALSATYMVRDMVSIPAQDFGPAQLEAAVSTLAAQHSTSSSSIVAEQLLALGFPQVHAVGRAAASDRAPRFIELTWGSRSAPNVTLVGKGVCYDTGGLSLKPTPSMITMKKDMAGAAQILGLAHMIMDAKLNVFLRVLIPAVENAVSAASYRPGDVLTARNGVTTLNGNSDAEGRLILADALVAATEENPDLVIDCATLTGAQRIAMGPDIPSFFCTDDELTAQLSNISRRVHDLMWPMPLYEPYRKLLDTPLADIKSCGTGGHAGCITAALYLKEFVGDARWIHVDMMGYNTSSSPGRPEGGEAMGMRALFEMLKERYS